MKPDVVHILVKGRLRATGGPELADALEATGCAAWLDGEEEAESGDDAALARPPDPMDDPFGLGPFKPESALPPHPASPVSSLSEPVAA